jgi:hypothetical protein
MIEALTIGKIPKQSLWAMTTEACENSDGSQYGTLSTTFVRTILGGNNRT